MISWQRASGVEDIPLCKNECTSGVEDIPLHKNEQAGAGIVAWNIFHTY